MYEKPVVSVICLCYNHLNFLEEALHSVLNQTYPHLEVILIDDKSDDGSQDFLIHFQQKYPWCKLILHTENQGNCKSFNHALEYATGKYVIDFATDDVLHQERIQKQVEVFEQLSEEYGVIYTDAVLINAHSQVIGSYYQNHKTIPPSGDIFVHLLKAGGLICTPTMMMRKLMIDELGGYDENLSYEDYDFWVRSGRKYWYYFMPEKLTYYRKIEGSLSTQFYQKRKNHLLLSTFQVCQKALFLCRNEIEKKALAVSIRYHARQALWHEAYSLCNDFLGLLLQTDSFSWFDTWIAWLSKHQISLYKCYTLYRKTKNRLT